MTRAGFLAATVPVFAPDAAREAFESAAVFDAATFLAVVPAASGFNFLAGLGDSMISAVFAADGLLTAFLTKETSWVPSDARGIVLFSGPAFERLVDFFMATRLSVSTPYL